MIKFQTLNRTFNYLPQQQVFVDNFHRQNPHVWDNSLSGLGLPPRSFTVRQEIKIYIKEQLHLIQEEYCIYCGNKFRSISSTHREHIIPKCDYPQYAFYPKNLVLSCDLCNGFEEKGEIDFTLNRVQTEQNYDSLNLSIIHPYLDNLFEHLDVNNLTIRAIGNSPKGLNHIGVFKLNEGWKHDIRAKLLVANKRPITEFFENLIDRIKNRVYRY